MSEDPEGLPLGLGSWVPVLRGGAAPRALVRDEDGPAVAAARWSELESGGRLALTAGGRPGGTSGLDELEEALPGPRSVERFVVLPGTGGGFVLLPTHSADVLRGGLELLPAGRRRWRAARLGLGALAPLGVARRLGLTELALVTKDAPRSAAGALAERDLHLALAAGVPDARQTIVARVVRDDGACEDVVKLAHGPSAGTAITSERDALQRLAGVAPELGPALKAHGETGRRRWIVQERLDGRRSPDVFTPGHAAFLSRLWIATRSRRALAELAQVRHATARLDRLDPAVDPDWHAEASSLAAQLEKDGSEVPTCLAHGDFTSWNLAVGSRGMRAFDWEASHAEAPALYDLLHFHVQTGVLVHRRAGSTLLDSLRDVCVRPARQLVEGAELAPEDVLRCLGVYLLDVSTRDELDQRTHPVPFIQLGLLRRARRELVRRVAGLLAERRVPWSLARSDDDGAPSLGEAA